MVHFFLWGVGNPTWNPASSQDPSALQTWPPVLRPAAIQSPSGEPRKGYPAAAVSHSGCCSCPSPSQPHQGGPHKKRQPRAPRKRHGGAGAWTGLFQMVPHLYREGSVQTNVHPASSWKGQETEEAKVPVMPQSAQGWHAEGGKGTQHLLGEHLLPFIYSTGIISRKPFPLSSHWVWQRAAAKTGEGPFGPRKTPKWTAAEASMSPTPCGGLGLSLKALFFGGGDTG